MKKSNIKYASALGLLLILTIVPVLTACFTPTAPTDIQSSSSSEITLTEVPNTSGKTYSPDGKGWLQKIGSPNKWLVHLEGSPYEIGFQHGYLLGEGAEFYTSTFVFKEILLAFLGIDQEEARELLEDILTNNVVGDLLGWLIGEDYIDQIYNSFQDILDILVAIIRAIVNNNLGAVPSEYIEEARGIADGAQAAGYDVRYENVIMLNMGGFDALLSILYPAALPFIAFSELLNFHMCDGFVAFDRATSDGRTWMGRSWMFDPIGIKDYALVMEYVPNNGYKFVSVGMPGFVGVTSAMNVKGIGIGIDMVPALDNTPGWYGMGVLLTARYTIQYKRELSHAVNFIGNTQHGVSWLYLIGDGKGWERGGAVVEVSSHWWNVRYHNYEIPWWQPWLVDPIEHKRDVVTVANHYVTPGMLFGAGSIAMGDSLWRYETLTRLVLSNYGRIDATKARDMADYLHPPNYDGWYGNDPTSPVEGTRTAFDLTNTQLWTLYGYNDHPFVYYDLD